MHCEAEHVLENLARKGLEFLEDGLKKERLAAEQGRDFSVLETAMLKREPVPGAVGGEKEDDDPTASRPELVMKWGGKTLPDPVLVRGRRGAEEGGEKEGGRRRDNRGLGPRDDVVFEKDRGARWRGAHAIGYNEQALSNLSFSFRGKGGHYAMLLKTKIVELMLGRMQQHFFLSDTRRAVIEACGGDLASGDADGDFKRDPEPTLYKNHHGITCKSWPTEKFAAQNGPVGKQAVLEAEDESGRGLVKKKFHESSSGKNDADAIERWRDARGSRYDANNLKLSDRELQFRLIQVFNQQHATAKAHLRSH